MANDIDFDFFDSTPTEKPTERNTLARNETFKIEAKVPSIASDLESDSDHDTNSHSFRRDDISDRHSQRSGSQKSGSYRDFGAINNKRPPRPRKASLNSDRSAWSERSDRTVSEASG